MACQISSMRSASRPASSRARSRATRACTAAPPAVAVVFGVATGESVSQAVDNTPAPDVYRIGPEDTLLISVWKNDAITKTVPVGPDGMISRQLVQDVQAAGLTPMELRDAL